MLAAKASTKHSGQRRANTPALTKMALDLDEEAPTKLQKYIACKGLLLMYCVMVVTPFLAVGREP